MTSYRCDPSRFSPKPLRRRRHPPRRRRSSPSALRCNGVDRPTAAGWTPDARRLRGPAPALPPEDDPRGKGTNQVLATVRGWPRWAAGAAVGVVLIAAAASGGEDDAKPVSVVGKVETTLTLPLASTAPAPPVTPVTQAPTTEATAPATTRAPATTATTAPATTAATVPATSAVYYNNCAEVRAAGKDPIYRGQPGYRSGLDGDSDGIACDK